MILSRLTICLAAGLVCAACGSAPPEHFYTLEAITTGSVAGVGNHFSVSIGAVTLPEAVDRAQMVVRLSNNQIDQLEDRRWAESLRFAIPRVVSSDLGQYLPGANVSVRSDAAVEGVAKYRVTIDVLRFESRLADGITLEARWRIQGPGSTSRSAVANLVQPVKGNSYDALAAAHGEALATLSGQIAMALRTLESGG